MIIIREELTIFKSIMTSFHVFDNTEKFDEYKEQMSLLDLGLTNRTYNKIDKTILKFLTIDNFKNTTMENFIKIQKILQEQL